MLDKNEIEKKVTERFLKYVSFGTQSNEDSDTCPSTSSQLELGKYLKNEWEELGLVNVILDEYGYVYGTLPASKGYEDKKALAYIAHQDTAQDAPGDNIKTHIDEEDGLHVIRTDKSTLLGADDKAGLSEMVTAVEVMMNDESLIHPEIRLVATVDEEIGRGVDHIDLDKVNAAYGFTIDGSDVGDLEYENFNAAMCVATFKGYSIHTGDAFGKMKNAILMATEFIESLPKEMNPATTKDRDGFIHPYKIEGDVSKAEVKFLLRDFDTEKLEAQKFIMNDLCHKIINKYGQGTCMVSITDQYKNMCKKIKPEYEFMLDYVREVYSELNITPIEKAIRGGTDGASLSYMGLPTPNLGDGAHDYHSVNEHVATEDLEKVVEVLVKLAGKFTK
ncbi:MAG: tripeptide aminopeptidase PepT [Clostridia bacterium]|nr:tripeptide aminopeptidase PepT [Clostridia bacterium]